MFKHIMVATDLSDGAKNATIKAVQIAHQFNSKITILNVHEEFMGKEEMEMLRVSVKEVQEKFREIALEAKSEIKSLLTELQANDIETNVLLREGTPSKVILKNAKDLKIDLIVMGTKGKDTLYELIIGSTTKNVTRSSHCPVLTVPS